MNALSLLTELLRQGVRFEEQGGKLRVITPRGIALGNTLKREIIRHGDEILLRLRRGGVSGHDVCTLFPGAQVVAQVDLAACARCGEQSWWTSQVGLKVCGRCFPPALPSVVATRGQPTPGGG
ncbi:MAG: hypothetical protein AB7G75_10950 [Candidatus Binatia bacterium]